jgi:hypothetical protein
VAEFVAEIPIPTIALPTWVAREAWWLVLVAHEIGHHIQKDLAPGIEAVTRDALAAAVASCAGGDLAADWVNWQAEVFADAYSVLMVGEVAVAWALTELAYTVPERLEAHPRPGDRHPPAAVRLALLTQLSRRLGLQTVPQAPRMARAPATTVDRHLPALPAVADALVDLPLAGSTLGRLSGIRPDWFAAGGRVPAWSAALRREPMTISQAARRVRPAARQVMAAGVGAYLASIAPTPTSTAVTTTIGQPPDPLAHLHNRLVDLLTGCGEPSVPAAGPPTADVDALAGRLSDRLLRLAAESAGPDGPLAGNLPDARSRGAWSPAG